MTTYKISIANRLSSNLDIWYHTRKWVKQNERKWYAHFIATRYRKLNSLDFTSQNNEY